MKKGLLSILALAVTIVGCQNYDDQFDALNTQISALKSQVEGLSAVQSQITSLSGTLASLQATVNALPSSSDVSSAIASELADIVSDVEALQAALDAVATAEDLADVSDAVTAAQDSLEDLLTSSNVYGEDLIVNSQGTLDYAVSLGEKLAIVNGNVVIDVTPQMNLTDVQTVLDNIGTVVNDFTYITSGAVSAVTFNNIVGVDGLEVSQDGPYSFEGLVSAGDIHFEMSTKVTAIHLDALTTVSSINVSTLTDHGTGGAAAYVAATVTSAHAISGTKLAALRLGALPYYSNGALSITMANEEATIDIASLASVDADGDEASLNLTVDGAAALDFSNITQGNITAKNVVDLTGGADHDGNVTLENVVNVVLPNLTGSVSFGAGDNGSTLETFHAIGGLAARAATATADTTHSSVTLSNQSGLTSVIIDGDLAGVTISGNSDLISITYTADAGAVSITNNSDITGITLAGTAQSITVGSNSDLATLDIDTELNTSAVSGGTAATTGSLSVTSNANLTTLHSAYDPVSSITVTGNTDLTSVDFTGTATVGGATAVASVDISGNDLTAETVVDTYEAATATNLGSISNEAGLNTLSTYVTAAAAALGTTGSVVVKLDKIEDLTYYTSATDTTGTEVSDVDSSDSAPAVGYLTVVNLTPNTAGNTVDAVTAEASSAAWEYTPGTAKALDLDHTFNGITTAIVDLTATSQNPVLAIDEILSTEALAAADAVGVTLGAIRGGSASLDIEMQTTVSSATSEGVTGATNSTTAIATTDIITITVNGKTATGTPSAAVSTAAAAASEIAAVWNAAIAVAGNTISNTMFDVDGDTVSGTITITGKQKFGSLTNGKGFAISVAEAATATGTLPIIGYKAGNFLATTDNTTVSNNIIVSVTSDDTGEDADTAQAGAITANTGAAHVTALTTSATADVNAAVDGVTAVPATSNATTTNRMAWISAS
ncbi:MAG: beta strand repeat-containing protein [Flavobacteriaceae bacterium]